MTKDYPITKQPSKQNPHTSVSHKMLRTHMDPTSVLFPVDPSPDGAAPVNRHSQSFIDATRALIERVLVLITLNPFERVAVSLKLVSMLLHCSSPPASLVFDVFFMRTNSQKTFENFFNLRVFIKE